jgi:hypothetical protein
LTDFLESLSSDGRRVLEADLGDEAPAAWIERARERDAELLWLHTNRDLSAAGFEEFPGYARLRADHLEAAAPLPRLRPEEYVPTLELAYRGLWGHKHIAADAEPPPGALVLGLYEEDEPVGLCTIFPAERLVDGPGLRPGDRKPAGYVRLLLGACTELGAGTLDLDSWGDEAGVIAAYEELGFTVVERVRGWQLRLV